MTIANNCLTPTLHLFVDATAGMASVDLPGDITICPGATLPASIASVGAAGLERPGTGRTYKVDASGGEADVAICSSPCFTSSILAGLLFSSISSICLINFANSAGIAGTSDCNGGKRNGVAAGSYPDSSW